MLTLTNLTQRIEALEKEQYSREDEVFKVWLDVITFQFWRYPLGDNWREVYYNLPHEHPVRKASDTLGWKIFQFYDMITCPRDGWFDERLQIAIDSHFEVWIEEGVTYQRLTTVEAMREAFIAIDGLMNDTEFWQSFYEQREKEAIEHEQWLKSQGENMNKTDKRIEELTSQVNRLTAKISQPIESEEEKTNRIYGLIEERGLMSPVQPKSRKDEIEDWLNRKNGHPESTPTDNQPVLVGRMSWLPPGSITIRLADGTEKPVKQGETYLVSSTTWANLQKIELGSRPGDWVRLTENE